MKLTRATSHVSTRTRRAFDASMSCVGQFALAEQLLGTEFIGPAAYTMPDRLVKDSMGTDPEL